MISPTPPYLPNPTVSLAPAFFLLLLLSSLFFFFFFNDTATTEIYTLSLHDALPIFRAEPLPRLSGSTQGRARLGWLRLLRRRRWWKSGTTRNVYCHVLELRQRSSGAIPAQWGQAGLLLSLLPAARRWQPWWPRRVRPRGARALPD